ncbi:SNase-domain-containing protein [Rhizodiscina lignyota]|uniref:Probable endonuclease LCL3 n=1 Tax=Rhizodiscina lignyota TaxID=1504668 RepID=A0A9P4II08_9PEZI|nr:SNase-domain-containing protein [Rhizodiscina lignyota]
MRWPWSHQNPNQPLDPDEEANRKPVRWTDSLNKTDWKQYLEVRNLVPTIVFTVTTVFSIHVYKRYLRRIPSSEYIKPSFFRRRSLLGTVTSVGDGDNFRLFHTPGGRIAGWGWLPWRRVPTKREDLKEKTVHVRIAGIDAPELAHFGRPAQPFGEEALQWLTKYILHRRVRAYIYRRDQYDRVVATVFVRQGLFRRDVGLQMLRNGLATVYEAKFGSEFGKSEKKYREAEAAAKQNRVGMWATPGFLSRLLKGGSATPESPRAFKTRMTAKEKAGADQKPAEGRK